jgi:phage gpG-like protein
MSVLYEIQLDTLGVDQALAGLDARAGDLSPLMDDIGAYLEQMARDRIEATNVGPDGTPWPVSLRAELDGGKTLFETGRLAASLTHLAGRDFSQIGSNVIYAGVHQEGAIITGKGGGALVFKLPDGQLIEVASVEIPARPYLGVSDDDETEILALTADYLLAPVRAVQ